MSKRISTRYQGLSTLEVLEEAKNYNAWIAHEIAMHINTPSIEIGAGIGNLTKFFIKNTPLFITDSDTGLINLLKKKFYGNKDIIVEKLDIRKIPPNKYLSYFSSVYAINVLEHIKEDHTALKHMNMILKKGGTLVLLVPAKKIAYTKLDQELGHFRRYEKKELTEMLTKNGYNVKKIYFFNFVGLFSWYFRDKAIHNKDIKLKPHHIAIFDRVVPFLRLLESRIKVPVGISLIAVAKKI